MKYEIHYDRLIARAKTRVLSVYSERHHIIPRCMGGSNKKENIVRLTPEEHYVAHQLLVRMYPTVPKLAIALIRMSAIDTNVLEDIGRNNKAYGWVRRAHAKAISKLLTGRKQSDEHIKNKSGSRNGMYGKEPVNKGKTHTQDARTKISLSKYKPCEVNGAVYRSRSHAAAALGVHISTVSGWIKQGKANGQA